MIPDRDRIAERLAAVGYVADRDLAMALWLMDFLKRPLLLEGEAGVGKTEVAKALAAVHGTELIRLQCYEGLDQNAALYEWNYQRQLLAIKAREGIGENADAIEEHIFSEKYLLERPLLAAIRRDVPPVLLVDEVDRADEEFEAFLLELLSDFQVSIPELGTVTARAIPRVVPPPTVRASCRTRCAAAASITMSTVPTSSARRASSPRACRRSTPRWPGKSPAWWRRSARRTCASCPESRRPSTGRRPWPASRCMTCGNRPRRCRRRWPAC
jgi:hypothetical protein